MPRNSAIRRSSCLWICWVPQIKRNGGQAVAPAVEGVAGGGHDGGVVGEAEVVVGAEVEHLLTLEDAPRALVAGW